MRSVRRSRAGFTLVEMLVTLAITATLATIVVSTLKPEAPWADDRYRSVASQLDSLRLVIAGFELFGRQRSFVQDVTIPPGVLSDLTHNISATVGEPNNMSCKGKYSQAQEARKWNGPYWNKVIGPNGLVLGRNFVAHDSLSWTRLEPGNNANQGWLLAIRMLNVPLEDAQALALLVDGNTTGTGGTVRFTPSGSSPVTVTYNIVVSGCAL